MPVRSSSHPCISFPPRPRAPNAPVFVSRDARQTGLRDTFGQVKFDLGEPFLPFEQLLGCLPGASANFLPSPYARLMVSPDSPIIDFYPEDFEVSERLLLAVVGFVVLEV